MASSIVHDIVVIGAGVSGIAACARIHAQGLSVRLLDARTRVGGRLLSTPGGADLGGSWVWAGDDHVVEACRATGIELVPQRVDGEVLFVKGRDASRRIGNQGGQIVPCGPEALRLSGGYAELPSKLAQGLPLESVMLGCKARAVELVDTEQQLSPAVPASETTAPKTIRITYEVVANDSESDKGGPSFLLARYVIIAMPPRLAARIDFRPALPRDQARRMGATATWAGDWTKVVATFETAFWRKRGESGAALTPDWPVGVWWESSDTDTGEASASLAGFAVGLDATLHFATAPSAEAEDDVTEAGTLAPGLETSARAALSALFGEALVTSQLKSVHCKIWGADPLTYAAPPPGSSELPWQDPREIYGHPLLRRPLGWGVSFAGTETETQSGHVEGALIAGQRTANEALAALLSHAGIRSGGVTGDKVATAKK